jgi:hypothetical protein
MLKHDCIMGYADLVRVERSISSPYVRAIMEYWLQLRGTRSAPQISDLDPLEIPASALPHVILSDLYPGEPFRIKFRLVGTHITGLAGGNFAGKFLDQLDLPADINDLIVGDYDTMIKTCQPAYGTYRWPSADGEPSIIVQYVGLPLLKGDQVTRFLCAEHVYDETLGGYLQDEDLFKTGWRETA